MTSQAAKLVSELFHYFANLKKKKKNENRNTVVPGFRVLGFSILPGFRALKAGDGAWSVHKTLFGFSAPVFQQKNDL